MGKFVNKTVQYGPIKLHADNSCFITTHKRKNDRITLVIAFRGTADWDDCTADLSCSMVPVQGFDSD